MWIATVFSEYYYLDENGKLVFKYLTEQTNELQACT